MDTTALSNELDKHFKGTRIDKENPKKEEASALFSFFSL